MDLKNNQLDFSSVEFATNPDNILAPIRELKGLYPHQLRNGPKVWIVTRRQDVESVLLEGEIFKVSPALMNQSYENNPFSKAIPTPAHLLANDGDKHKRLKQSLERFFTPETLETYRDYITGEVKAVFVDWKSGQKHDLVTELSYLIPVKVIAKMLGLKWQRELPGYGIALQMAKTDPEYLPKVMEFHSLISKVIFDKEKHPDERSIISVLLKDGLTYDEILSMSLLLFMAGSGTTASLISQGLRQIIINKNHKKGESLNVKNIVDEVLFRTSPANSAFPRYVHKETNLSGSDLRTGDIVIAMLSSANYDNKNGEDPLKDYLSFSRGIHYCVGPYIAKMQAEIIFGVFSENFPMSKIMNEKWFSNITSRDLMKLEVIL